MSSTPSATRWHRPVLILVLFGALFGLRMCGSEVEPPACNDADGATQRVAGIAAEAIAQEKTRTAGPRELVREQLAGSWSLQLQVLDTNGAAVASASVDVLDAVQGGEVAKVVTDREGFCEVVVREDRVAVRATHADVGRSLTLSVSRDVDADQTIRMILWRPVQMTGVALGRDAQPLRGVQVELEPLSLLYGSNSPHVVPPLVVTDGRGRFSFEAPFGLEGFAYMRVAGRSKRIEVAWTAEPGGEVVVAVPGAFRIEGLVTDAAGNVTKANVSLAQAKHSTFISTSRDEPAERFSLDPKKPGKHSLVAVGFDGFVAKVDVEVTSARPRAYVELTLKEADDTLALAPVTTVEDPTASIWVDVFTADGKPAKRVWLSNGRTPSGPLPAPLSNDRGPKIQLSGRTLWGRPMRILVYDAPSNQYGWLELKNGPLPPRMTVVLQPPASVDFVAKCRGRDARGVMLHLSTEHTDFVSGRGKHLMQLDEVPPGPAVLQVRRGFEVLATKNVFIRGGVTNYETIEVKL